MKKILLFVLTALMVVGCSSDNGGEPVGSMVEVSLNFSEFDVEMTRAVAPISDYCNHLDVWVVSSTSTDDYHQTATDAGFGSVRLNLVVGKQYTIYAVAHKCSTDATLADGIISFPDDKVTQTLYYTTTFTPANSTGLQCEMQRIVAQFRLSTLDAIPDNAKKMRITLNNVFDRWNVSTGGTHQVNRVSTINITGTNENGTATFTMHAICTDEATNHQVTLEALTANDQVIATHTMTVPLRNGYRTNCVGNFFYALPLTTFVAEDWQELDNVEF